jgi:hypothetical protein
VYVGIPDQLACFGDFNLHHRSELRGRTADHLDACIEQLLLHVRPADGSDGLSAYMLRLGANMETTGPDPALTGGQYYLVINGSLQWQGASYPAWSTLYVASAEAAIKVHAGATGWKRWF